MFTYIKSSLDGILKQWYQIIPYYLIFPIALALVFGKIYSIEPVKETIIQTPIIIEDNDKTTSSLKLTNYIIGDKTTNPYSITTNLKDAKIKIVIPKGYEVALQSKTNFTLELLKLDVNDRIHITSFLENDLNNYHEQLYLQKESSDNLNIIYNTNSVTENYIDQNLILNSNEHFSTTMISFLGISLIMLFLNSSFVSDECGLSDRLHTLPVNKSNLFNYDFVTIFIIVLFFKCFYLLFFRFLNLSFTGNPFILTGILLIDSFYIASLAILFSSTLKKFSGTLVCSILPLIESLSSFFFYRKTLWSYTLLTPITKLYQKYLLYNNFNILFDTFLLVLFLSLLFYTLALIKNIYYWRFKLWVYTI